jgi:hypothetical protein
LLFSRCAEEHEGDHVAAPFRAAPVFLGASRGQVPFTSSMAGWGAVAIAPQYAGSFAVPYCISIAFDIIAAILALFVPRPIIRKRIAGEGATEVKGMAIPAYTLATP